MASVALALEDVSFISQARLARALVELTLLPALR